MKPLPEIRIAPRQRLRVLLVTDEMEVGGTQRQIVHLARGLDRSRFERLETMDELAATLFGGD